MKIFQKNDKFRAGFFDSPTARAGSQTFFELFRAFSNIFRTLSNLSEPSRTFSNLPRTPESALKTDEFKMKGTPNGSLSRLPSFSNLFESFRTLSSLFEPFRTLSKKEDAA